MKANTYRQHNKKNTQNGENGCVHKLHWIDAIRNALKSSSELRYAEVINSVNIQTHFLTFFTKRLSFCLSLT